MCVRLHACVHYVHAYYSLVAGHVCSLSCIIFAAIPVPWDYNRTAVPTENSTSTDIHTSNAPTLHLYIAFPNVSSRQHFLLRSQPYYVGHLY